MAHGSGPRASRPYQHGKAVNRLRRQVLGTAQVTRVMFVDGSVPDGKVKDAERRAVAVDRLTGRV